MEFLKKKMWNRLSVISIFFPYFLNAFLFLKIICLFVYLFMAALGLCCYTRAFSSCGEQGLLFIEVRGLLIVVASLAVEHQI